MRDRENKQRLRTAWVVALIVVAVACLVGVAAVRRVLTFLDRVTTAPTTQEELRAALNAYREHEAPKGTRRDHFYDASYILGTEYLGAMREAEVLDMLGLPDVTSANATGSVTHGYYWDRNGSKDWVVFVDIDDHGLLRQVSYGGAAIATGARWKAFAPRDPPLTQPAMGLPTTTRSPTTAESE